MAEATRADALTSGTLTWDFIKRLKDVTSMKVVIKGLESGDDAALAVASGADGVIVSNHGGRATETGRATIECLPEIVQAVDQVSEQIQRVGKFLAGERRGA